MAKAQIPAQIPAHIKQSLRSYLIGNPNAELLNVYLFYVERLYDLVPVLFTKEKTIYQSAEELINQLEAEGKLWHEAEIKIGFSNAAVDEKTTKIYICPFTGKVFGNNTHPAPQDAIYDWVSKCPENTERVNGVRVKRFFISDDLEVIKNYAAKNKPKAPISKMVYSSVVNGKLYNNKQAVIDDFRKSYLKHLNLVEVQTQNRYRIEDNFLSFIQEHLQEEKIAEFVEALAHDEQFLPYIETWLG